MTVFPRTLFGRNVLLILALIAFGQLTGALLFVQFVQKPRLEQLAGIAVRQIQSTKAMLDVVTAEQRTVLIGRINEVRTSGAPDVSITTQAPPVGDQLISADLWLRNLLMTDFAQLLAQRLQQPVSDIHWINDGSGEMWVPIKLGDTAYWLSLKGIWIEHDIGLVWLSLSLLTGVLAVCGAYLIQRRINQPLHRLVVAATQLANGETPVPLSEDAPTEIATVSRSFNKMTESLGQIDRERTIMLAGVSHDLRTPLAKLRLGIAILQSKGDTDVIDNMTRSCEEMDSIIEQFLNYARAGSAEALALLDINELVRDCAQAYAADGQKLTTVLDDIPPLPLRRQAMERLLTNLVENALRYGKPEFRITTRLSNKRLQLSVIDQGPGIPAAELETIKRPFVRGNVARNERMGAGLGLAIVERIAQLHGGTLRLVSAREGGLEAVVEIPLENTSEQCSP